NIPDPVLRRLHAVLADVLKEPATIEELRKLGNDPVPMSPGEFKSRLAAEVETWTKVIAEANIERICTPSQRPARALVVGDDVARDREALGEPAPPWRGGRNSRLHYRLPLQYPRRKWSTPPRRRPVSRTSRSRPREATSSARGSSAGSVR